MATEEERRERQRRERLLSHLIRRRERMRRRARTERDTDVDVHFPLGASVAVSGPWSERSNSSARPPSRRHRVWQFRASRPEIPPRRRDRRGGRLLEPAEPLLVLVLVHGEPRQYRGRRRRRHEIPHDVPRALLDPVGLPNRAVRPFHRLHVELANELPEVHQPVPVLVAVVVQRLNLPSQQTGGTSPVRSSMRTAVSNSSRVIEALVHVEKCEGVVVGRQAALQHLRLDHGVDGRLPRWRRGPDAGLRALFRGVEHPDVVDADALAMMIEVRDPPRGPVGGRVSLALARLERGVEALRLEKSADAAAYGAVEITAHHHGQSSRFAAGADDVLRRGLLVLVQVLEDLERPAEADEGRVAVVGEEKVRVDEEDVADGIGTTSRVGFGLVAKVQERGDAVAAVVEEDVPALDHVEISRADGGQQAVGATARARGDVDDVARRGQPALVQAPNVLRGVQNSCEGMWGGRGREGRSGANRARRRVGAVDEGAPAGRRWRTRAQRPCPRCASVCRRRSRGTSPPSPRTRRGSSPSCSTGRGR